MKCKECQEYILTDYLDDSVSDDIRKLIEQHMSFCKTCKEFADTARKVVIEPFEFSESATPPESIWENIKEEITEQNLQNQANWLTRLKEVLFPKYGLAFASLTCLVLMIIVLNSGGKQAAMVKTEPNQIQEIVMQEVSESAVDFSDEVAYVAYLFDQNNAVEEYGTSIEEYFL